MGATNSFHSLQNNSTSIKLDNPRIYYPGDIVTGTLHYKHTDDQKEPISIDLIGEFGFTAPYSSVLNQTATDYDYHLPFFNVSTSSITDGEKFALCLDEELPPSINLLIGTCPCIQYYLQVNLNKGHQHRQYIVVCPRVSIPRSIIKSQDFEAANHKEMHLSGTVDRNWVLPGDTLHITFEIKNPHHKHIRYINGNIFMKGEFTEAECHGKIMDFVVDNVRDTNEEHITTAVSLKIPSHYLPPTFTYLQDHDEFYINISYWIVIEMHVRGLFNTISTTIPLCIGFEPENINFDELYKPEHHHGITVHHRTNDTSLKQHRRHSRS
jgi:hypothetical protein